MTATLEQRQRDCLALKAIAGGVERLRARMLELDRQLAVTDRGYFLADEDDQVRRLFLAYRNYRIALQDVLSRYRDFSAGADEGECHQRFLLGFGAAVLLYNWSTTLVTTYRDRPTVRAKLNEPDQRFGIEPDLFETIYESLTRLDHLARLREASLYFVRHRHALRRDVAGLGPDGAWLYDAVREQHRLIKRSWAEILTDRIQEELDNVGQHGLRPFADLAYRFQSLVVEWFGGIWLDGVPSLPPEHLARLRQLLVPGDIMLVRPERKSSTFFLPGYWTHAALYYGGTEGLRACGAADLPAVRQAWPRLTTPIAGAEPTVIEALAAGVVLNPLPEALHVDHVVVLRPLLEDRDRLAAFDDAFGQLGKEYDFEFDFSRTDRIVCTELIYRAFHGKGAIRFAPVARFGRPTLSADDLLRGMLAAVAGPQPLFRPIAVSRRDLDTGVSHLREGADCLPELHATLAAAPA